MRQMTDRMLREGTLSPMAARLNAELNELDDHIVRQAGWSRSKPEDAELIFKDGWSLANAPNIRNDIWDTVESCKELRKTTKEKTVTACDYCSKKCTNECESKWVITYDLETKRFMRTRKILGAMFPKSESEFIWMQDVNDTINIEAYNNTPDCIEKKRYCTWVHIMAHEGHSKAVGHQMDTKECVMADRAKKALKEMK